MIISKDTERAPWASLIGWTRAIASRFAGTVVHGLDDNEFRQTATDQNPSALKNGTLETGRQVSAPIVPICC